MEEKQRKPSYAEQGVLSEHAKKFDPTATPRDCVDDLRRVQALNPHKFITRIAYRIDGKYSDATWNRHFGTFLEFRRQAQLELSREQHTFERQIAKHASVDVYRAFQNEVVNPYLGLYNHESKTSGLKPIAICSDVHDLMHDSWLVALFLDTVERLQPTDVGVNGDLYDMPEFSEYANDPRIAVEVDKRAKWCVWFLSEIRRRCPNARIVLNLGNHEWRLLKHMANRTPFMKVWLHDFLGMSMEDLFGVKHLGVTINCKWNLAAWKKTDVEKEVNKNHFVFYDTFIMTHINDGTYGMPGTNGHTHKPKSDSFRNIPMGHYQWTVTGRMCVGDLDYHAGFDRSTGGFMIAHVDPVKKKVYHEPIVVGADFAVIGGKYYYRPDPSKKPRR